MLRFRFTSVLLAILATGFLLAKFSNATTPCSEKSGIGVSSGQGVSQPSPTPEELVRTPVGSAVKGTVAKTVQISLNVDADVLIEGFDGKRIGFDFKSKKFVNEIPSARAITQESSATYVLPFDNTGRPYRISVSSKSVSRVDADFNMTGPGFVVGFRGLPLTPGEVQTMTFASNGLHLSFTANHDGPTPQLFLTEQSGRAKPSYRFEVASSLLEAGKTITVDLDTDKGRLYFKTDDVKKDSFTVKMRRTNPGGTRDMFAHKDISFGKNSYAMDFGQWDGKGEICFYEVCDSCKNNQCTKLKNESSAQ
jgi:hypothetical protein